MQLVDHPEGSDVVKDLRFRVEDLGIRVKDLGIRVKDLGFWVWDLGFWVWDLGSWGAVWNLGCRVQGVARKFFVL